MTARIFISFTLAIILLTTTGCFAKQLDPEAIHERSSHLSKLSLKLHLEVRKGVTDAEELLNIISNKYPKLINEFSDYVLVVKEENGYAVILMCNAEKSMALLEDVSCKGGVENGYLFKEKLPCDFQLDIEKTCAN